MMANLTSTVDVGASTALHWEVVRSNVHAVTAALAAADSSVFQLSWASVLCFAGGIVSAAGGVGGGGLYVPVLILAGGLSSQDAVPVSTAVIFGNAFASLAFNAEMRHPTADRPLIDLHIVLLLEPPTLTGAIGFTVAGSATRGRYPAPARGELSRGEGGSA